ncbi:HAMP domain-containing sensor histidine kinase [Conexibacter sp. CPCC 206217]|uniref:sensor histidine kinase n=1 Tax=Conexibacter sp. CPCC 206217 TaxID=3064574 RepID=UPI002720319E|nr:HAMP domain-containing sensor histidine kinase [Conexibacter sp. CPCC 206217]MDO8213778.1 HAMP domain-containing sensor histidine kinase [Conexibacter sp. CPCC 206217]
MSRLSLRVRVALAAALAIAIAVALLGAATVTLVDRQLHRSLDDGLRDRAVEVSRLVATTPRLVTAAGVLEGRVGTSAAYVQVIDAQGRIVARSGALGGRVLPEGRALARAVNERVSGFEDEQLGDEPLRVYAAPLPALGGGEAAGGAVAVAGTTQSIDDTLGPLHTLVLIAALLAAALAGLLAILLTRRALRPLTRLTEDAEAIARTGDPARRLGTPGADEVGRLTATLNAMLDSLAHARARERRFVDDASHELRTPLTALRGNAAFVARHGADAEALADIEADAARLTELLDDLLALAREDAAARPGAATAETVDLAELARTVARDHPRASVATTGGRALVRGEHAALERALRNLVENAEQHGPTGSAIEIAVAGGASTARVSVSDAGAGLTATEGERAFQRFWRGERAAPGGSGLGLAIVRATAERHGGGASVSGATFTLELPLKDLSKNGHTTPASPDAKDHAS